MFTLTLANADTQLLEWGVVIGASLAAAVTDLRSRRIPNALTMPVLLGGLTAAVAVGGGVGLADACAGAVLLALPYLLLYRYAGGGGGDAKLMAAVGAWLGVLPGVVVLVAVSGMGIVLAGMWIALNRSVPLRDMPPMPYGVAISLGVCVAAAGIAVWPG